jgi:hypothetical protein
MERADQGARQWHGDEGRHQHEHGDGLADDDSRWRQAGDQQQGQGAVLALP